MPKAKELRPFVERLITIAKRGLAGGDANGKSLHARRLVLRDIQDRDVVGKLFDTIAPRFEGTAGRLHADPADRLPPRRQRRGRADRARRQRVQPERRNREDRGRREGEAEGRWRPPARGGRAPAREEGRGRRRRRRGAGREQGQAEAPAEERQGRPRHHEGQGLSTRERRARRGARRSDC